MRRKKNTSFERSECFIWSQLNESKVKRSNAITLLCLIKPQSAYANESEKFNSQFRGYFFFHLPSSHIFFDICIFTERMDCLYIYIENLLAQFFRTSISSKNTFFRRDNQRVLVSVFCFYYCFGDQIKNPIHKSIVQVNGVNGVKNKTDQNC